MTLGGGGNIGYWVESAFLKEGHDVVSISRGHNRMKRKFPMTTPKLSYFREDINLPSKSLQNEIKKADVIIDFLCFNERDAFQRKSLLSEFSGLYLMVSSVALYDRDLHLNTLSTLSPANRLDWPYARKKYEAELVIKNATAKYEKKILRLGHTFDISLPVPFGPSNWTIPKWLLEGKPLLIHRSGGSIWPILHSLDAAKRIHFVANNPKMFSNTINIVAESTTTWNEIGLAFFKHLKLEPKFKYIAVDELRNKNKYWSDSVYFHKQFDEVFVGVEQDLFKKYLSQDIDVEQGLYIALEWYLSNEDCRIVDAQALYELSMLG
jgi:nucleoside-diphosphate-sugar epimerase